MTDPRKTIPLPIPVILALAGVAIFAVAIIFSTAPFLHDYAEWAYQGKVLSLYWTSPDDVAGYSLYPYPVPYALSHYLIAAYNLVFPPILAAKLFLLSYVLLSLWVYSKFLGRYITDTAQRLFLWVLLVCLGTFSSFFWYGYIGYQLGFLLFLYFLSVYRSNSSASTIAVFGMLTFFAHATIFLQLSMFVVLAVVFFGYQGRQLLGLLPSVALSGWFLYGRYFVQPHDAVAQSDWVSLLEAVVYKLGMVTMHGPFKNFLDPSGASLLEHYPILYWAGVATNLLVVTFLGGLYLRALLHFWRGGFRRGGSSDLKALAVFSIFLLLLYAVAPYNFFGIVHPGGRVILPFFCLALVIISAAGLKVKWSWLTLVVLVTLTTLTSYLITVTRLSDLSELSDSVNDKPPEAAARSVMAYNDWLYRNTRYKYYNYRIFVMSDRYDRLEKGEYRGIGFTTGPISGFDGKSNRAD